MHKIKELLKNEKYYSVIFILIASIFVCLPLMSKNIDMTYDDGIQHIARLMGTYQSLQEGQTNIMSNFVMVLVILGIYFTAHLQHFYH